jgi:hypothetical protein
MGYANSPSASGAEGYRFKSCRVQQRVNPDLHVLGAIITNAHRRRKITGQVAAEVNRLYPVLGVVRTDSRLLSATTAGLIHKLTSSKALNDYAEALNRLEVVLA